MREAENMKNMVVIGILTIIIILAAIPVKGVDLFSGFNQQYGNIQIGQNEKITNKELSISDTFNALINGLHVGLDNIFGSGKTTQFSYYQNPITTFGDIYKPIDFKSHTNQIEYPNNIINDYHIQQIKQWETNRKIELSNHYISQLADQPNNGHKEAIGESATLNGIGLAFKSLCDSMKLNPVTTEYGAGIYNIATSLLGGITTGLENILRTGRAMQTIDPPIYTNKIQPWGSSGNGLIEIDDNTKYRYWENIFTGGNDISRIHLDLLNGPDVKFYQSIEIKTSDVNPVERFMMKYFPLPNYFDPTTTRISKSYSYESTIHYETRDNYIQLYNDPFSSAYSNPYNLNYPYR